MELHFAGLGAQAGFCVGAYIWRRRAGLRLQGCCYCHRPLHPHTSVIIGHSASPPMAPRAQGHWRAPSHIAAACHSTSNPHFTIATRSNRQEPAHHLYVTPLVHPQCLEATSARPSSPQQRTQGRRPGYCSSCCRPLWHHDPTSLYLPVGGLRTRSGGFPIQCHRYHKLT